MASDFEKALSTKVMESYEVIVICRYWGGGFGYCSESKLRDFPCTSSRYEFYNVLRIEWENGIAYRRAFGRVLKDVWESQPLEWVDVNL
jgi:hypothetical protein